MKKNPDLAILTIAKDTRLLFEEQLNDLLKGKINMKGYSLEEGIDHSIDAKMVLTTKLFVEDDNIDNYVKNIEHVVVANRALQLSGIDKLLEIPVHTKALLVCSSKKSTVETADFLKKVGFNHIEFIPYFPGDNTSVPDVKLAVTTGKSEYIPENLEIIDIYKRQIGISTIIQILIYFDLIEQNSSLVIAKYIQRLVALSKRLNNEAVEVNKINNLLKLILDHVSDGILYFDREQKTNIFNKKAGEIFDIAPGEDLDSNQCVINFLDSDLEYIMENKKKIKNDFRMACKNRRVISSIFPVDEKEEIIGALAICKDITEIKQLEEMLRRKLRRRGHIARYNFSDIIGQSSEIIKTKKRAENIANSESTVFIQGETGTGKELFAQAIHNNSHRNNRPFIAINCATIPKSLFESELFGYADGAFTDAKKGGKAGVFEQAKSGTIFLDEIGDIPKNIQTKLLRVLEEREVMRVGSTKIIPVDVRIIAATNVNIKKMIEENNFREDLYYRLNVLPLKVPTLRSRRDDILTLLKYFLKEFGKENIEILPGTMSKLYNYSWPGNVRQLRNCAEYISRVCKEQVRIIDLPEYLFNGNLNCDEGVIVEEIIIDIINSNYLFDYLFILNELFISKQLDQTIGRRQIARNAGINNLQLSSQMVRSRINNLASWDLVEVGSGRQGTTITNKGIRVMKKLQKKSKGQRVIY